MISNILFSKKVNKTILSAFMFTFILSFLTCITMYTASDREGYLRFFETGSSERFEILFVYYGKILSFLNSPEISVLITVLISYMLLAKSWVKIVNVRWFESFLLFNGFAFLVFHYFISLALRNGLALSLAIFAAVKIFQGKRKYFLLLIISPFFHYGVSLFVGLVVLTYLTSKIKEKTIKQISFISLIIIFLLLIPFLEYIFSLTEFEGYYLSYIYGDLGKTERFRSFSMILMFFLSFGIFKAPDSYYKRIFIYSLPFLIYYFLTGIPIFHRLLAPSLFFTITLFVNNNYNKIRKFMSKYFFIYFLIIFNVFSMLYAYYY